MTYRVFLDIDGVFTSTRLHRASCDGQRLVWSHLDPVAVRFMNVLHRRCKNLEFTLSSAWRHGVLDSAYSRHLLFALFDTAGAEWTWARNPVTPVINGANSRAQEIQQYLAENPAEDFIIFDDIDYGFNKVLGKKRFVQTNGDDGLLLRHINKALAIMGDWTKNGT